MRNLVLYFFHGFLIFFTSTLFSQQNDELFQSLKNRKQYDSLILICKSQLELPGASPKWWIELASALKFKGNYKDVQKCYQNYLISVPDDKEVKSLLTDLDLLTDYADNGKRFQIQKMNWNTDSEEFGLSFFEEDKLFFITKLPNAKKPTAFLVPDQGGDLIPYKPLSSSFINKYNIQSLYFSEQEQLLMTTRGNPKKDGHSNYRIDEAYVSSGKVKKSMNVWNLNPAYSYKDPCFSADGKTLYFSSNMPGGLGGFDIYKCIQSASGIWSKPINLGKNVNSKGNEQFPFIIKNELYFSSDGRGGYGGMDIFVCYFEKNFWTLPVNLGNPVNSSQNDFGFVMHHSQKRGFFLSNRDEGTDSDVFYYNLNEQSTINITVTDEENEKPINNVLIQASKSNSLLASTITNESGQKSIRIFSKGKINIKINADGYFPIDTFVEITTTSSANLKVQLTKNSIRYRFKVLNELNLKPVRSVNIILKNTFDGSEEFYYTNDSGIVEVFLIPSVLYELSSNHYSSIKDQIAPVSNSKNKVNTKEYVIDKSKFTIMVPVASDCFSPGTLVNLTNLGSGDTKTLHVNEEGQLNIGLEREQWYIIEQNGKTDSIYTKNLKPGDKINLSCKFTIGQTWLIENLYWDMNKAVLRKESTLSLDKLVNILNRYPNLEVEIGSHTDCRGDAKKNEILSANRAKAVVQYLASKKVNIKRILAIGYGENKLVNKCSCELQTYVECSEAEHDKNRRTEVKVLKY